MLTYRSARNAVPAFIALVSTLVLAPQSIAAQERVLAARVQEPPSDSPRVSQILARPAQLKVREVSLEAAFEALESSSGVTIAYSPTLLPEEHRVTCMCQDVTVEEAMAELLRGTGLDMLIAADQVVVRGQSRWLAPQLALNASSAWQRVAVGLRRSLRPAVRRQQEVLATVSGRVTELGTERPLASAGVRILDTELGALTDAEGRFEIANVPAGEIEVQVQLLGYLTASQSVTVPAEGTVTVDFQLEQDALALDEIVVTAFGVEREARAMTTSTQSIATTPLTEARELNVVNSLQGKVAGLNINPGGSGVGGESRVILRGNRSITGNSQPLLVLDGTPIRGSIEDINPDVIARIDVLKGANAAALYGSDAQNGAIVITTHRGAPGAMRFSLNQTVMAEAPYMDDIYQNVYGQGSGGVYSASSEHSWGPRMEGQMVDYWTFEDSDHRDGQQYAYTSQPNNIRDAFRVGLRSATNLTASMGDEVTQGMFSYTGTTAEGMVLGNEMTRHNVSLRVTSEPRERLTVDTRLTFMRQSVDNPVGGNRLRAVYRLPRSIRTEDMRQFEYINNGGLPRQDYFNPETNSGENPYWVLNNQVSEDQRDRFLGMASLTYSFTDALSLMGRVSYDGSKNSSEEWLHNDTYDEAIRGAYALSKSEAMRFNADVLLTHGFDIGDVSINSNLGGNIQRNRNSSLSSNTGATGLIVPNLFTLGNTQIVEAEHSIGSPYDVHSVYASTQVGWRDALFFDLTARNDWSSTLPADARSYLYPSIGLSAIVSDLVPALPDFVSYFQLRSSWAKVGNAAPPFMLNRSASVDPGGHEGFLTINSTLPNSRLVPEQTRSLEIGADIRFLEDRLGVDATWYKTNTGNQLFTVALPVGSGAEEFFTNGGDVENKGFELILSASPVRTEQFFWDINATFAANRNTVVAISDERPQLIVSTNFLRDYVIEEGEPYGNVYGRDFLRDEQGRVVVASNGLPQFTQGKTELIANYNPDWTGGISSSLSYGPFDLGFVIDHRQGGTVASQRNAILSSDGVLDMTLEGREGDIIFGENFFEHETAVLEDGSPNDIPIDAETFWKAVGGTNAPVGGVFVEDATNTRLRELTLGYDIPASVLRGLPVSNLRVSLVGRNLLFLYKKSDNLDADILAGTDASSEGYQAFAPPTPRTIGLNVKVDF